MINYLSDKWIPTRDGLKSVSEMLSSDKNDSLFHRREFAQFLEIFLNGVVQTFFCPRDAAELENMYNNPPSCEEIEKKLKASPFFELFNLYDDKHPFMQFSNIDHEGSKATDISVHQLFIGNYKRNGEEMPQSKNVSGWFNSVRFKEDKVCVSCSGLFSYIYQITAKMDGVGHYISIGGDKTLMTSFYEENSSVWKNCCLNVKPYSGNISIRDFGWTTLTESKTIGGTNKKHGAVYNPEDFRSPVYAYWQSPRKIKFKSPSEGHCTCCGKEGKVFSEIQRAPFGIQYAGDYFASFKAFNEYEKDGKKIRVFLKLGSDNTYFELIKIFTQFKISQPPKFSKNKVNISIFGMASDNDSFINKRYQKWNLNDRHKMALEIFSKHAGSKAFHTHGATGVFCEGKRTNTTKQAVSSYLMENLFTAGGIDFEQISLKNHFDEINKLCLGIYDKLSLRGMSKNPKEVAKIRLDLKNKLKRYDKGAKDFQDNIVMAQIKNILRKDDDLGGIL